MQENSYPETDSETLNELYQEVILDHSKNPRCQGEMTHYTCSTHGHNAMCGDKITLYLLVEDEIIRNISFKASGCAISVASASLMSEAVKGKSVSDAVEIFDSFHALITEKDNSQLEKLGETGLLAGVQRFPTRIKCATLGWHALKDGIARSAELAAAPKPTHENQ
jgi:nitrogen fixation protein NifU and related proteins